MTDIVTITINPSLDLSTAVEKIIPVAKLRGSTQRHDPGGGGINVARVINRLGGEVRAIYPIGGVIGELVRKLLEEEGVASETFRIKGETRQDFFVHEISSDQQYRFILPGPQLAESEWQECLKLIAALEPFPRFLVASGSLPRGVPDDFYARVARIAKQRGAMMILDTAGPALAAAVSEGLDMIKPNLREMCDLSGVEATDELEWEAAAREIVQGLRVRIVALTMGHLGAALVTRGQVLRAHRLPVTPLSAVGAGDSFLGALVLRLAQGADIVDCFRYAMAAGAAALLHPGTDLCRPDDIERLAKQVVMDVMAVA